MPTFTESAFWTNIYSNFSKPVISSNQNMIITNYLFIISKSGLRGLTHLTRNRLTIKNNKIS